MIGGKTNKIHVFTLSCFYPSVFVGSYEAAVSSVSPTACALKNG